MPKHKSHLTAISRKTLPLPTRWLLKNKRVSLQPGQLDVLDFGCGKCISVNPVTWDNYDPHYKPWNDAYHKPSYDIIICNYVLCTLPRATRMPVLKEIQSLLKDHGIAYISVRNDKPKQGWGVNKRGTYQGRVSTLKLPLLYECASFRIYVMIKITTLL